VKSEQQLVEKALLLSSELSKSGPVPMLVGGLAMRFHASSAFRQKYNGARSGIKTTDTDFALSSLPPSLARLLCRDSLQQAALEFNGRGLDVVLRPAHGEVFHLKPENCQSHPLLSDACFFSGSVGMIRLAKQDFELAASHHVSIGGKACEIRVADVSLLVATNVNPGAISQKRTKRASFAIMSANDLLEQTAERVAEIFGRSGIGASALEKSLREFYRVFHGYSAQIANAFMDELSRHLAPARKVKRM
jgi:hypothetical protein